MILISLIALFSVSHGEILKATIIVVLIKASVSPHTPLTAHLAVLFQGCLGEIFFFSKRFFKVSALLFAVTAVVLSALQRVLILTIVFGNTLWKSIDAFSDFLYLQLFGKGIGQDIVSASLLIISAYVLLHLLFGLLVGFAAGKIPGWVNEKISGEKLLKINIRGKDYDFPEIKITRKRWWNKKSGKIFLFIVLALVILSYFHPELKKDQALDLLIMLLRSFLILFIWFTLISPLLYKSFRKLISSRQISYFSETNKIISTFLELKKIVLYSWKGSLKLKGLTRVRFLLISVLTLALVTNFDIE